MLLLVELEHAIEHHEQRDVVSHRQLLDALLGGARDLEIELAGGVSRARIHGALGAMRIGKIDGKLVVLPGVVDALAEQGVIAGVAMSRLNPRAGMDDVLITCATEMNTDADIAAYVKALKAVLA